MGRLTPGQKQFHFVRSCRNHPSTQWRWTRCTCRLKMWPWVWPQWGLCILGLGLCEQTPWFPGSYQLNQASAAPFTGQLARPFCCNIERSDF